MNGASNISTVLMTIYCGDEINIGPHESSKTDDGRRFIDGVSFEIPESIPKEISDGKNRLPPFFGTKYIFSVEQARVMHESIGRSLNMISYMEKSGKVVVEKKVENLT